MISYDPGNESLIVRRTLRNMISEPRPVSRVFIGLPSVPHHSNPIETCMLTVGNFEVISNVEINGPFYLIRSGYAFDLHNVTTTSSSDYFSL